MSTVSTNEIVDAARLRLALTRVVRALRRQGASRLSATQVSALSTIEDLGPLRISAIAAQESLGAPAATRVVADLEAQGLVERAIDPIDKRASLIELSALGRATMSDLWSQRTLEINRMLEKLTPQERLTIEAALPALEKIARD
ncbi:MAG TPA: MarR family transcriptional regulator [Acidimicrobiales bacterium]|nr:MarR family transcriptional regulator [Acidimicrobiales bacterium]